MSKLFAVLFFSWSILFVVEIGLPLAEGNFKCSSSYDCRIYVFHKICCNGSCTPGTSCVGNFCQTDGDCGGKDECCSSYRCTTYNCSECHSNSNCSSSQYCCKHQFHNDHNVCRRSCAGETCHWSGDCGGPDEYCSSSSNKCRLPCSSDADCVSGEYCCGRGNLTNKCRTSCVWETCHSSDDCGGPDEYCSFSSNLCRVQVNPDLPCSSDADCVSGEYCCGRGNLTNKCRTNCVGEKCSHDGDCGWEEFCNTNTTKCEKSVTSAGAFWVVTGAVLGSLLLAVVGCGVAARFCFRGRSRPGHVVQQRPARVIQRRPPHVKQERPAQVIQERPAQVIQKRPAQVIQEEPAHRNATVIALREIETRIIPQPPRPPIYP